MNLGHIHDIHLPLIQSDKCITTLTPEVPQDKSYMMIMWCCHLLGSSCGVSVNLFSDAQIGPSVANLSVLWLAVEGMYGRSSGENVFRAFISTSSDWFPLQLHVLALALQRPLLVTGHFDWWMNSSIDSNIGIEENKRRKYYWGF